MSETEHYRGKLKKIDFHEDFTLEAKVEYMRQIMNVDVEWESDDSCTPYTDDDNYMYIKGDFYEVVEKEDYGYNDIAETNINEDGTISFHVKYHNGGTYMQEMIEDALEKLEKQEENK